MFIVGLNQLLWYYADMEKKQCPSAMSQSANVSSLNDPNACTVWRRFAKYAIFFTYKYLLFIKYIYIRIRRI